MSKQKPMQHAAWKKAEVNPRSCGALSVSLQGGIPHTARQASNTYRSCLIILLRYWLANTGLICFLKELMGALGIQKRQLKHQENSLGGLADLYEHQLSGFTPLTGTLIYDFVGLFLSWNR